MIPLYRIEEHNEALYIWNKATKDGFLPAFGNTLLHVDHHPDFECSTYNDDMEALFSSLEDIHTFTYQNTGIADFICPAVYQGIFNELVLVLNFSPLLGKKEHQMLSFSPEGMLAKGNAEPLSRLALLDSKSNHRLFCVQQGGFGEFDTPQAVALDIDIDYFCWDDSLSTVPHKRLEITKEAYCELNENPYHPFRLFPMAWVRPVQEEGRYYISYVGLPKPQPLPEPEQVEKRIVRFTKWLQKQKVSPSIISICRSRYSGYTPAHRWEEIENSLLKHLAEVYAYDLQS